MRYRLSRREAIGFAARLAEEGVELAGLPADVAEYASRATADAVMRHGAPMCSTRAVRAYFDKVVERRLVRSHGGSCAAARVVAGCIVADLVESGRTPSDAFEELSRGWSGALPDTVLEEYRRKLCA